MTTWTFRLNGLLSAPAGTALEKFPFREVKMAMHGGRRVFEFYEPKTEHDPQTEDVPKAVFSIESIFGYAKQDEKVQIWLRDPSSKVEFILKLDAPFLRVGELGDVVTIDLLKSQEDKEPIARLIEEWVDGFIRD